MVPFSFAGETFFPSSDGALFWPSQQALLVADLHLEKASWFARLGQFLPPYDSHATLSALAGEVERTGARRLYCLGDSFHDRFGCERLPPDAREVLEELTSRLDWTWIVGNHDPGFADHCGGRIEPEVELAGIILRHEALREESRPEISGHYHPKLRLHLKGRRVSRR
ncbi:MAG TPA: ligase-associated DNA damage response endonuclease PdeM, partial [Sphingomicrobium sp.]|nr:ligase-associated DNA damage response endonuclease PdeM [Sphingomicrobium sp.]